MAVLNAEEQGMDFSSMKQTVCKKYLERSSVFDWNIFLRAVSYNYSIDD